ncbi:serine/threonine-protein kinase mos [Ischnura elegans]|uniref:serine/threonine-protein kinase mos n=1 Tax=Ischnura elegans TaxID=197161 RepID=UPI001ED88774|nr:serine/threonine-protein kinase mos [Ischnura elegans]
MSNFSKSLTKLLSPRQYSTLPLSPNKRTLPKSPSCSGIETRVTNLRKGRSHQDSTEHLQNKVHTRNTKDSQVIGVKRLLGSQLQVPSNIPLINSPLTKELSKKGVEGIASSNILGRGRFGTVIKGLYKESPIAVKIIAKGQKKSDSFHKEENAVKLTHPNIARVIRAVYSEGNYDMILMEYCNGANLLQKINDVTFKLDIRRRVRYALDVAYALQHCHRNKIVHLDVKPNNIVIDSDDHCKLCDFGSSRVMETEGGVKAPWPGTPAFAAPEVLQGLCVTCKVDVYSFGITMWQMLSREPPYFGEDIHSVIYKAVTQNHRPRRIKLTDPEEIKYMKIYENCWVNDYRSRPSIDDVILSLLEITKKG